MIALHHRNEMLSGNTLHLSEPTNSVKIPITMSFDALFMLFPPVGI